jgi:hypothetical protein
VSEINKLVKLMELRKIFHSPLANHFSSVVQSFRLIQLRPLGYISLEKCPHIIVKQSHAGAGNQGPGTKAQSSADYKSIVQKYAS